MSVQRLIAANNKMFYPGTNMISKPVYDDRFPYRNRGLHEVVVLDASGKTLNQDGSTNARTIFVGNYVDVLSYVGQFREKGFI